ncbi:putative ankyrin-repeat protein [Rhizina undulata]
MDQNENREAIHEACREGKISVVESLLAANPKLANRKDSDERLPIHWACSYSQKEIVELLVNTKGFDVDAQDGSGWTPLMIACSIKDGDDIVDILLARDADVNMKTFTGQTPLHYCASKNRLSLARKLLSPPYNATCRIKDRQEQLPLHRAAAIGSAPMVKLLLEFKSPINATDRDGMTPLHHAIAEGHGHTALALLKAGAETGKRDSSGKLAIELAPDRKISKWILTQAEHEGIDIEQPTRG